MPTLALIDNSMEKERRAVPAIARLGGGEIVKATRTQPWRVVGMETAIYQLRGPRGQLTALRVPLADEPDRDLAARWRAWSALCEARNPITGPPLARTLGYFSDGVGLIGSDLRSRPHPVMAMEWVSGPTLLAAADRAVRDGDPDYLLRLAGQWRTAITTLEGAGVSHGNLTGDNVLVTERDGIILVDYDSLWWLGTPNVAPAGANPAYNHPRAGARLPERRDRFPALLIYTSLIALAFYPELRQKHGDRATHPGGALLFAARDLAHPERSPLFDTLFRADEATVAELADLLRHTCKNSADDIPPLSELLRSVVRVSQPADMAPTPFDDSASRPPARTLTGRRASIEEQRREHSDGGPQPAVTPDAPTQNARAASDPPRRGRAWEQPAPGRTSELLATARLEEAIAQDDFDGVLLHWAEVRSTPSASRLVGAVNDLVTRHLWREVTQAREENDPARILQAMADAGQLGIAMPAHTRRLARSAERFFALRSRIEHAIANDDANALLDAMVSGDLDDAGDMGPEADKAIRRALSEANLQLAIERGDQVSVAKLMESVLTWDRDRLGPAVLNSAELARDRVAWVERVRDATNAQDVRSLHQELASLTPELEAMLTPGEQERVARVLERAVAVEQLRQAVQKHDDAAIFRALDEMERLGATVPADVPWARIAAARERMHLLADIRAAAVREPRDLDGLLRLLPAARRTWPESVPDLGLSVSWDDLDQDVRRETHRRRLREAIASGDRVQIRSVATPDPLGVVATLDPREQQVVSAAIAERPTYVPPVVGALGISAPRGKSE